MSGDYFGFVGVDAKASDGLEEVDDGEDECESGDGGGVRGEVIRETAGVLIRDGLGLVEKEKRAVGVVVDMVVKAAEKRVLAECEDDRRERAALLHSPVDGDAGVPLRCCGGED